MLNFKRNEVVDIKHWAAFILIKYFNVAKALRSWTQKGKFKVVPLISVYFIVAQHTRRQLKYFWKKLRLTLAYLILIFTDILQRKDKVLL